MDDRERIDAIIGMVNSVETLDECQINDALDYFEIITECLAREHAGFGPAVSMKVYEVAFQDLKKLGVDVSYLREPRDELH